MVVLYSVVNEVGEYVRDEFLTQSDEGLEPYLYLGSDDPFGSDARRSHARNLEASSQSLGPFLEISK